MNAFKFDPVGHKFTLNGVRVESVTEILKGAGLIETRFMSEEAMTRGSYLHQAIEIYEDGELDEDQLDPVLKPYLDAYKLFKSETGFQPLEIEKPVLNEAHLYAGILDAIGVLNGSLAIVDHKTGQAQPWHGLQLAAYRRAASTPERPIINRYGVYLSDNGKYKLKKYDDPKDEEIFLAALNVYRWKKNKGG